MGGNLRPLFSSVQFIFGLPFSTIRTKNEGKRAKRVCNTKFSIRNIYILKVASINPNL